MALIEEDSMKYSDCIGEGRRFWRLSFDLESFVFLTTRVSNSSGWNSNLGFLTPTFESVYQFEEIRSMLLALFWCICNKELPSGVNPLQYLYEYSCYKWRKNYKYPSHKNLTKLQTGSKDVHCSIAILIIFPGRRRCLSYLVALYFSLGHRFIMWRDMELCTDGSCIAIRLS